MKMKRASLLFHGIINVTMHIPCLLLTSFMGVMILLPLAAEGVDTGSPYILLPTMLPLFILPVSCVAGIVRGCIHIKDTKYARYCLIFSVIGLILYIGMMWLIYYVGSRY